jgi:hypothetical protein
MVLEKRKGRLRKLTVLEFSSNLILNSLKVVVHGCCMMKCYKRNGCGSNEIWLRGFFLSKSAWRIVVKYFQQRILL